MNYNELILLLLLIITLLILIFHYYINICNNTLTEPFSSIMVGDKSCLVTEDQEFPTGKTSLTTYNAFKNQVQELNYHSDYTCKARLGDNGVNNIFYSSNNSYTSDISANKLLLAYNCLEYSPTDIKNKLIETGNFTNNDLIIIGHDKCIINDNKTLENIIVEELSSNNNYTGPIYACIAQAPFLEGQQARGDIIAHGTSCYIKNNDKYGYCNYSNKSFKCHILLVKTSGKQSKIKEFVDFVKKNKTNDNLCHLFCHKNNNLGCGCLNLENSYDFGGEKYSSVCYGPDNNSNNGTINSAPITNYSMIYFLNPYNIDINIKPWNKYDY